MKFIADDGKIFDTMEECEKYEKMNSEGKEIAQLWHNYITTYDETGHIVESSYDFKIDVEYYLDHTIDIVKCDAIFLNINCKDDEWEKITNYLYKQYGLTLPSYTPGFFRYDCVTEEWISFYNEYKKFEEKWAPVGIRF